MLNCARPALKQAQRLCGHQLLEKKKRFSPKTMLSGSKTTC